MGDKRPRRLKARVQAAAEYFAAGSIREDKYTFGLVSMKWYVGNDRRLVICFTESLSVQDLLNVGFASARDGLRRTVPRSEKKPRPCKETAEAEHSELSRVEACGAFHETEASGPSSDIRISMLASPQGASVLNIWMETLGRIAKGGPSPLPGLFLSTSSGLTMACDEQG